MRKFSKFFAGGTLVLSIMALAACGSTKVYTAEKTMLFRGNLYTLSGLGVISSEVEAEVPDGEPVDLRSADKDRFNTLKGDAASLKVQTFMMLGEQKVPVETAAVTKYSQLKKMIKDLDSMLDKIHKFMKDPKKTQLELK